MEPHVKDDEDVFHHMNVQLLLIVYGGQPISAHIDICSMYATNASVKLIFI